MKEYYINIIFSFLMVRTPFRTRPRLSDSSDLFNLGLWQIGNLLLTNLYRRSFCIICLFTTAGIGFYVSVAGNIRAVVYTYLFLLTNQISRKANVRGCIVLIDNKMPAKKKGKKKGKGGKKKKKDGKFFNVAIYVEFMVDKDIFSNRRISSNWRCSKQKWVGECQ